MTYKELINSIANETINEYDIIQAAKDYPDRCKLLVYLWSSLGRLSNECKDVVLCETAKGTLVKTEGSAQETKCDRVMKAMGVIESYFGISLFEDVPRLPKGLYTNEAKECFIMAVKLGLAEKNFGRLAVLSLFYDTCYPLGVYTNVAIKYFERAVKLGLIMDYYKRERKLSKGGEAKQLPQELNTNEAKKYIQELAKIGIIEQTESGLKWKDTKQLLAYFSEQMSIKLNLSKRVESTGNKAVCWKPFETIFGIKGLREAKQNWLRLNTRFEPTGFEKIKGIFE